MDNQRPFLTIPLPSEEDRRRFEEWQAQQREKEEKEEKKERVVILDI